MTPPAHAARSGFFILLLVGAMMAANHVSARFAFNAGLDVATAVAVRGLLTALVVALIVWRSGVALRLEAKHKRFLPLIGLLIGLQSLCLYSAVARLPVALALLAFNTYPLSAALWDWLLYRRRVDRSVLQAMPVLLIGLAMALDVLGAAAGMPAGQHWARMAAGLGFALGASLSFGLAMILTQHEAGSLDGRVRTVSTLGLSGLLALCVVMLQGGPHWPATTPGWWGLVGLTLLYGTAFTIMFTVLPRLGVAGNSPIMNVEPVVALLLAWWLLGQSMGPVQVLGALLVVGTVMWLGLRKK